ncbi:MAG: linear amide C-N hydrolase [Bdellovibrionales bacterium]
MRRRISNLCLWTMALALTLTPVHGIPCSAFYGENGSESVMGKSYDWHFSHGYMIVNKRGVEKKSFTIYPKDKQLRWQSQYGSVTFNQYGHEFPLGGLNESGLAIEVLWLSSSQYPDGGALPSVNELQWIQYHLDTAGNVREMIENAQRIRISPVIAEVHYLACDAYGIAQFLNINKELVIHSTTPLSQPMDARSITNNTFTTNL